MVDETHEDTRDGQSTELWRERRDWAAGRVVAVRGRSLILWWGLSLLAGVLFVPSVWFSWRDIAAGRESLGAAFLVLLAFALITLGVLARITFRHTRQALRFAPAVLHLEEVPISLGGCVNGSIEAPLTLRPGERVGLELSCVGLSPTTGEGSAGRDQILWRHATEVGAEAAAQTSEGVTLPVAMPVGASAPQTGPDSSGGWVRWSLEAKVLPSGRWREVFDLPVFRTEASPAAKPEQDTGFEKLTDLREAYRQARKDLAEGKVELVGGRLLRRHDGE
jgi:hypothetical protein